MKNKFQLMTNYPDLMKRHIIEYNSKEQTDFEFIRTIPDEVLFVEIGTTAENKVIFDFNVQFGIKEAKIIIEGKI
ncbi:MAG: hypothetical protein R2828_14655 [Saprospiraceae bacterium]